MDEKQLAELFQDAVRDTPPASFGTSEVRRASHRATARRRNGIIAGSALAFVLLSGGAITAVALTGGNSTPTASAPLSDASANSGSGGTMYESGAAQLPDAEKATPPTLNDRSGPPKQGGPPTGPAGASAGVSTPSGCGQADRELVAALADELPAAAKTSQAFVPFGCPEGSRSGALNVVIGDRSGVISIVLMPPGVSPGFAAPGSDVPNSAIASAETATSHGLLYVVSQPAPGTTEPPFGDEAGAIAAKLAKDY